MRSVDTNILLRIVTKDDVAQAATANQFIQQGGWVSTVALIEAYWVLGSVYGFSNQQRGAAVALLLQHDRLTIQDSDAVEAALELFRARPSLGFPDCLILELARKAGHLPLGTFDRALGRADGAQKL